MTNTYRVISGLPVLVRVPLLPVAVATETYSAQSLHDQVREVFRRYPASEAALFAASSSLARAIRNGAGSSTDAKNVLDSALRYVVRMASRCTPFGLFSAVGTVAVADKTTIRPAPNSRRAFARLDRSVVRELAGSVEMADDLRGGIVLRTNDYARHRGKVSHVYSPARDAPALRRQIVESTPLVDDVRTTAANGITADELAAYLVESKGMGRDLATATIDALLEAGVLVSDFSAQSLRYDDDVILTEWSRGSDVRAGHVEQVRESLRAVNATPVARQTAGLYERLDEVFETAFGARENRYQLDSALSLEGTLGERVLKDVCTLVELTLRTGRSMRRRNVVSKFVEHYEGEALVPLISLADTPLLREIVDAPSSKTHDFNEAGHRRLMTAIFDAILGGAAVRFHLADFLTLLNPPDGELPASVEIGFEIVASDSQAIDHGNYIIVPSAFGVSRGAGRSSGRFLHLLPGQSQALCEWHESKEVPGTVSAELVFNPSQPGLAAVLPSQRVLRHQVQVGVNDPGHGARRIDPNDLFLGVSDGAFYLWSASLKQRVVIQRHEMVSIAHLGSDLITFLGMLFTMSDRTNARCSLGDAELLPYLPRVTVGNLVISAERWILSTEEATRERLDLWLEKHTLPRLVRVVENVDHALLVDVASPAGRDQLLGTLRRAKREKRHELVIEEAIGAGSPWLAGDDGLYAAEFIASLELAAKAATVRAASPVIVHHARCTVARGPDDGWLYYKIFCDRDLQDHVLRRVVRPLFREFTATYRSERQFFLRYSDPKPHLRVRVRVRPGTQNECSAFAWSRLLRAVHDNEIDDAQQAVYHPEVQRYGGLVGLELAEELFDVNSDHVLTTLASSPSDDLRAACALQEGFRLVDSLLGPAEMRDWLARPRRHRKLSKDQWDVVRELKAQLAVSARQRDGEVEAFRCRERLGAGVTAVAGAHAAMDFVDSVLHLNFNRYGFAHADEHYVREMLWHLCTGIAALQLRHVPATVVLA